jgi:hypothetical protein
MLSKFLGSFWVIVHCGSTTFDIWTRPQGHVHVSEGIDELAWVAAS